MKTSYPLAIPVSATPVANFAPCTTGVNDGTVSIKKIISNEVEKILTLYQ
jgi:hypothetical protein